MIFVEQFLNVKYYRKHVKYTKVECHLWPNTDLKKSKKKSKK